jgi:hypothetical protein
MHLIGQLSIDLRYHGKKPQEGFELQQQATRFCYDMLLPALERHFDGLVDKEHLLRIDRLDVDAGAVDAADNWDALLDAVVEAVKRAIAQQNVPASDRAGAAVVQSLESGWFEKWLYWLERGQLPLSASGLDERDFRQKILESVAGHADCAQQLRRLLDGNMTASSRLIRQHPDAFLRQLAEALVGTNYRETEQLLLPVERFFRRLHREISLKTQPLFTPDESRTTTTISDAVRPDAAGSPVSNKSGRKHAGKLLPRDAARSASTSGRATYDHAAIGDLQRTLGTVLHDFREKYWAIVWEWPISGRPAPDAAAIFEAFLKKYFTGHSAALLAVLMGGQPGSFNAATGDLAPALAMAIRKVVPVWPIGKSPVLLPHTATPQTGDVPVSGQASSAGQQPAGVSKAENPDRVETPPRERENAAARETTWYVNGAGLVLLHPFLPALFGALKLTDGSTFRNLKARQTAVYLLHYLATGSPDAPEYELVLPKFLCAWPEEEPLQRPRRLSAKAKAECRHLLEAALKHWGKLGSTTPEGLQNGFLQRPGKLSHTTFDGWKLQVEQSGIDILLNYLPWGIGMIKLPWMKDFLIVEWPH